MTGQTTTTTITVNDVVRAALRRTGALLRGIGETIRDTSHVARCAREAERLFDLSDAELARRGLKREEIIQHAFRSYMHI